MGTQLVRLEAVALLLVVVLGCAEPATSPASRVETTRGTIIDIRTTTDEGQVLHHQILAAGGVARRMHELDVWQLLELERDRVITVDEIARTWSAATVNELTRHKRALASGSIPASFPEAEVRRSGRSQRIAGRLADEYLITAGGFRRELWISREPVLDSSFMKMHFGAEQPGGPYPAALAAIHLQLMQLEGFPLLDVISLEADGEVWGNRREVTAIREAPVAVRLLRIPDGYTEASIAGDRPPVRPTFRVPASPR